MAFIAAFDCAEEETIACIFIHHCFAPLLRRVSEAWYTSLPVKYLLFATECVGVLNDRVNPSNNIKVSLNGRLLVDRMLYISYTAFLAAIKLTALPSEVVLLPMNRYTFFVKL